MSFAVVSLSVTRGISADSEEASMNWDRIEGNWKQLKGQAREQWSKLTDGELDSARLSPRDSGRAGFRQRNIEFDQDASLGPAANCKLAIQSPRALTNASDAMAELIAQRAIRKARPIVLDQH